MPLLLGVAPFGVIYGVVALQSGIPPLAAMAMSSIVFAGSAQFLLAQLVGAGAPLLLSAGAVGLVNLRHALYSASVAPMLAHLPRALETAAGLSADRRGLCRGDSAPAGRQARIHARRRRRTGYCLAPGFGLWAGWQVATVAGVLARCTTAGRARAGFRPAADLHCHRGADDLQPCPIGRRACRRRSGRGMLAALPYKMGLFLAALAGLAVGAVCSRETA
jgi:predicted branched-subunit amino acid permease